MGYYHWRCCNVIPLLANFDISLIAVALQTASQNLGMLTAARFLIGLGVQIGQGNLHVIIPF